MMHEQENPFSVTKATEFDDNEINEYWVNFNPDSETSFDSLLNPTEFLPKYIIGSKGCGKTHILRYFSFPLQRIRANNNVSEILSKDKYIGIYSILGGLNSSRFKEKGVPDEQWKGIFEYYFELYILDSFLKTLRDIVGELNIERDSIVRIIEEVLKSFTNNKDLKAIVDFGGLIGYVKSLRDKIDAQILNAAFSRKLEYEEVKILFNPGDLIFGIPLAVSKAIANLNQVKFIFILDEYEKLFEWQKVFVNTMVWDKRTPVTFWIGARRHGYTTRLTKMGEPMVKGSEFEQVDLDYIIRSNLEIYKTFAKKLYLNRLIKYYESKNIKCNRETLPNEFCDRFQKYEEEELLQLIASRTKKEFKHVREFRRKLKSIINTAWALDLKDENDVNEVVISLTSGFHENVLEQKYKIFFFYRLWSKVTAKDTYRGFVKLINGQFTKFRDGIASDFDEIKDKRKKDFIAQLCQENDIPNREYSGVEKFIELSEGNPRSFILTLKKTIEFAKIRGEKPLDAGGFISLDSQYLAIHDTARWFYEDAEVVGESGRQMYVALKNLADLFSLHRYCDKPTDTSVSSFYVKGDVTENTFIILDLMKVHSILIEDEDGRLEKNTGRPERKFQLNKTLAPLWNLPPVVRGTIYLNKEMADAVFDRNFNSLFERLYSQKKDLLNAPDFLKNAGGKDTSTLF